MISRIACLFLLCAVTFARAADKVPAPPALAPGVFLMDYHSGDTLWSRNADTPRCMASTTKMMTALLAAESGRLDDEVIVTPTASSTPESSLSLAPFERVSLRDLCYGVLLRSANDASVAVAHHLGGTEQEFVDRMNQRAAELGCKNTHYKNPNGLHAEGHVSSPRDLAIIGRAVLANDFLRSVVGKQQYTIERSIRKQNRLVNSRIRWFLKTYPGANGIKSGYTRQAGRCLVASASRGGRQLIAVVLNSPNVRTDIRNLLDWGFANTQTVQVVRHGQSMGTVKVRGGARREVAVQAGGSAWVASLKGSKPSRVEVKPARVKAPVKTGEKVGDIVVSTPGRADINLALVASSPVEISWFRKAGRFILWTALAVLVVLIVGTIAETSVRRRRLLEKRSRRMDTRQPRARERHDRGRGRQREP